MKSFNRFFFTGSPVMNSPPYSTLTKPDISDFAPLKKFAANSILCRVQKFGLRVSRGDRAEESARKGGRKEGIAAKNGSSVIGVFARESGTQLNRKNCPEFFA